AAAVVSPSAGGGPAAGVELTTVQGSAPALSTRAVPATTTPHQTTKTSVRKRTEARTLVRANSHGATSTIGTLVRIEGRRLARPPSLFSDNIGDLVTFELARVLKRFPELNGFYADEQRIGLYDEVNVGISFDNGANLKVLALQNADAKTLSQIQQEFMSLLELYESNRTIPAELLGSATVTISDLSGTGADFMLPLINGDQSLIIGITRATHGFGLHASFDHRVSEGLQVAKLLEELSSRVASHFSGVTAAPDPRCSACDRSMNDERALGHRGFLKIALPGGAEGQLCRSCFEGF
ncbi:MAG TPA: 2-oxo acid dehydrogenase subunit E2, partial [Polyangiales bacterium]|nr:2-oxo acid dehydrogenase subunit E2 [Polyangiales bacterium]